MNMKLSEYKKMAASPKIEKLIRGNVKKMVKKLEGSTITLNIVKQKEHPEQLVQRAISDFWEMHGAVVIKVNNAGIKKPDGSYIPPKQLGVSDLIICYKGYFIAIEVKAPGQLHTASYAQNIFIDQVRKAHGMAMVADSPDSSIKLKDAIDIAPGRIAIKYQ